MVELPAPAKLTALDLKAEIVCAYIEAGGNIVEVISALASKGIKAGRQKINSIIRTDPQIVEWTKKHFDKSYTETCGNRLEAVSAAGIQRSNETTLALLDKTRLAWFRELGREKPNAERLTYFSEFVKWNSISFINQNLVYSRFRDGLHAKNPLIDQSQHRTETLNFPEGSLPNALTTVEILRAHVDRLKPVNRIATLPVNGQGDNGATA